MIQKKRRDATPRLERHPDLTSFTLIPDPLIPDRHNLLPAGR